MAQKTSTSANLPSYKNPPVNEVVCGIRFESTENINITHFGLLWEKFQPEYPNIKHAAPITSEKRGIIIDTATGAPLPRVWFINDSNDKLIQFQLDSFYFNWRRQDGEYPRYDHIIECFEGVQHTVNEFFKEYKLGEMKHIEYELNYINHLPVGDKWISIETLNDILTDFHWTAKKERFLPIPNMLIWDARFILPEQMGELSVNLKPGIKIQDRTKILILELRVRCKQDSIEMTTTREWFDLAHEWIVRGFTDITTAKMHKEWQRIV
jgi:uncharacterized protein (TIGR04255 family)